MTMKRKHTEDSKKKMSESHRGVPHPHCGHTSSNKGKFGAEHPLYNTHQSEEAKEKNRISHLNKHHTEKTKEKMKDSHKRGSDHPMWNGGEKLAWKRKKATRRELGFIPLNEYFEGSHGHHINDEEVIYIPEELHRAYPHNHKIKSTMIRINIAAMLWLKNKDKKT